MIKGVYTVYDTKGTFYLDTFLKENNETAIREFGIILSQNSNLFSTYPQDFTLFKVGTFDTKTGLLHSDKESICNGVECLAWKNSDQKEPNLKAVGE